MQVSPGWIQAAAAALAALLMVGVMIWQGGEAQQKIETLYELEVRVEDRLERMEAKFDDLNTRISRMEGSPTYTAPAEPGNFRQGALIWETNPRNH